jgi:Short C-terminal domain
LKQLADLKDQGILTEAEFNDQKAKILAEMS